jgi:hypothetical protein
MTTQASHMLIKAQPSAPPLKPYCSFQLPTRNLAMSNPHPLDPLTPQEISKVGIQKEYVNACLMSTIDRPQKSCETRFKDSHHAFV